MLNTGNLHSKKSKTGPKLKFFQVLKVKSIKFAILIHFIIFYTQKRPFSSSILQKVSEIKKSLAYIILLLSNRSNKNPYS